MNEGYSIRDNGEDGYRLISKAYRPPAFMCWGDYETLEELNRSLQPIENQMELFDLKEVMYVR